MPTKPPPAPPARAARPADPPPSSAPTPSSGKRVMHGLRRPSPMAGAPLPPSAPADLESFVSGDAARSLPLASIRRDPRAQPRARLDTPTVESYRASMAPEGQVPSWGTFPPVVVYQEGAVYFLADGFHRLAAAEAAGLEVVRAEVRAGGLREAILFSVGANATHGLPRSNDDKRRAVLALLQDAEWSRWSDRAIGERAAVDHKTVGRWRRELAAGEAPSPPSLPTGELPQSDPTVGKPPLATTPAVPAARERIGRDGRTTRVDKIGKSKPAKAKSKGASKATSLKDTEARDRELLAYVEGFAQGRREAEEEARNKVILRTPQTIHGRTDEGRRWLDATAQRTVREADQLAHYTFMMACSVMDPDLPEDLRESWKADVLEMKRLLVGISKNTPTQRLGFFLSRFRGQVVSCKKVIEIYRAPIDPEELPRDPQLAAWRRQEREENKARLIADAPCIQAKHLKELVLSVCPDDGDKLSIKPLAAALQAFADDKSEQAGGHKTSKYKLLSDAIKETSFAQTPAHLSDRIKDQTKPSKLTKKAAK